MSVFYPLVIRDSWDQGAIVRALSSIAVDLDYKVQEVIRDEHQDDAERIISDFIRDHGITEKSALDRLRSFQPMLSERYQRLEHHWADDDGRELTLVVCESNLIPFEAPDISLSGNIWFACGWAEFVMSDRDFVTSDREIERLGIDQKMQKLPLLYAGV